MRKLTLVLAAGACMGLAAPAFATEKPFAPNGQQVSTTALNAKGAMHEFSSQDKKKKKKKSTTGRSSWGG